ncbi:MAG TPA: TA system VapC family ribonuclease toxin [Fimbriimonas sp.]|nr:TA system VapC family ribonuclease toxin [Fimbriimonas sp.]
MIVTDLNLLVYAFDGSSPFHERARRWLENLARTEDEVGLAWVVCLGFVRITTSKSYTNPISRDSAMYIIDSLLREPNFRIVEPGPQHWEIFTSLMRDAPNGANIVTDAHLAALAKEHRAEMHSNDRGFEHFKGIRLHNPLLD